MIQFLIVTEKISNAYILQRKTYSDLLFILLFFYVLLHYFVHFLVFIKIIRIRTTTTSRYEYCYIEKKGRNTTYVAFELYLTLYRFFVSYFFCIFIFLKISRDDDDDVELFMLIMME